VPQLICTVRDCGAALTREADRLRCTSGHTFDRARSGYWNLLQPQDRRSDRPGDRDEAVAARSRWLARGFAAGLAAAIATRIEAAGLAPGAAAVDVGCGEGSLTASLLAEQPLDACGVDLSTAAIRSAARAAPALTWIVANADRGLPFASGSVDLALSIFGRRPAAELSRVLAPGGTLIVAVPAEDDLIELREASQGRGLRAPRTAAVMNPLAQRFALQDASAWRHRAHHDREALLDALAMSYRGARKSEGERIGALSSLDVTLSAEILTLVPRDGLR
jgi:23S rRNA (guanine745-N1)-methyltransferase